MMAALSLSLGLSLATISGAHAQQGPAGPVGLGDLHDALHLTASQEAGWRAYVAAVTPTREMQSRQQATEQMLPQLPTPRRLALIQASMAQDAADFQRQGQAINAFYAQLTPEQQRTFDRETIPPAQDGPPPAPEDDNGGANRLMVPPQRPQGD
jgi:hypothetical protein